jgi:hypothetical protein
MFTDEEVMYLTAAIVALVWDETHDGDSVAFSTNDLADKFASKYEVELGADDLDIVFQQYLGDQSPITVIKSPFSRTYFDFPLDYLDNVLTRDSASENVWQNFLTIGPQWIKECTQTILSKNRDADLGEKKSRIPASDRYVALSDNQEAIDALKPDLASVAQETIQKNDIADEQRLIILSEIAVFEQTICQQRLSVDLIERFLEFCKSTIVKFVGAAIATSLINRLSQLIERFVGLAGT